MKHFGSLSRSAVVMLSILFLMPAIVNAASIALYYPPGFDAGHAKAIADAVSQGSGLDIKPRIAAAYPEMIDAFSGNDPVLVYVGSFVQSMLHARGVSTPIVQASDGKEFYSAVLIAPASAGNDAVAIVKEADGSIAYAKGASSGESGAKAATQGKASVAANNHMAAVNAVKAGKARCAFVKNWWWEGNKEKFPEMVKLDYPGVSDHENPDNILSANKAISAEDIVKIRTAAKANPGVFGAKNIKDFDSSLLGPSLDLMKKAGIDPKNYAW